MSGGYYEDLRPWHRPGLEAAGAEDEWDTPPRHPQVPAQDYEPPDTCRHGEAGYCRLCAFHDPLPEECRHKSNPASCFLCRMAETESRWMS